MLQNTHQSFGSIAKFFHWSIAILIVGLLIVGFTMDSVSGQNKALVYMLHKSFGLLVLLFAILRLSWRFMNVQPELPEGTKAHERAAALLVHGALYLVMLAMPLSGWLMSTAVGHPPKFFGLFQVSFPGVTKNFPLAHQAHQVHEYVAYAIVTLLVLHTLAALYHHVVLKDDVLTRMLPRQK